MAYNDVVLSQNPDFYVTDSATNSGSQPAGSLTFTNMGFGDNGVIGTGYRPTTQESGLRGQISFNSAPVNGGITVSGWFRTDGINNGEFMSFDTLPNLDQYAYVYRNSAGRLILFDSKSGVSNDCGAVAANQWTHVAIVSTNNLGTAFSVYINGALTKSGGVWNYPITGPSLMNMAKQKNQGSYSWFDQMAFWNRGLTATEIQAQYNSTLISLIRPTSPNVWADGWDPGALGTASGGTWTNPGGSGREGNGIQVVGIGTRSTFTTPSGGTFGVKGWFKQNSVLSAESTFLELMVSTSANAWFYLTNIDGTFAMLSSRINGVSREMGRIQYGQWFHLAFTTRSTTSADVYLNGVKVHTAIAPGTWPTSTSSRGQRYGTNVAGSTMVFDEITTHQRAYSDSEIANEAAIYPIAQAVMTATPPVMAMSMPDHYAYSPSPYADLILGNTMPQAYFYLDGTKPVNVAASTVTFTYSNLNSQSYASYGYPRVVFGREGKFTGGMKGYND